jgi:hypothetical protein
MTDTINQVGASAPADRLREALAGLLAIVDDSQGVAGYHLNGAIAEWGEFPEIAEARAALAVQAEVQPVAQQIMDLILDECRYWQGRDEARRGGFACLYAKAREVYDASAQAKQPDASALVEALEAARLFIANGIELGYIRMPDPETPDPAHDTLPKIETALAAYRAQQAQGVSHE